MPKRKGFHRFEQHFPGVNGADEASIMNTEQKTVGARSISENCIRERAYEIYCQRGRRGDHAESDWLTAEAELKELKTKAEGMLLVVQSLTTG